MIRGNVETECGQVKRGKTECDQGKRGNSVRSGETWKLSVISGN